MMFLQNAKLILALFFSWSSHLVVYFCKDDINMIILSCNHVSSFSPCPAAFEGSKYCLELT